MVYSGNEEVSKLFRKLKTMIDMKQTAYFIDDDDFIDVLGELELKELAHKYLKSMEKDEDNSWWVTGPNRRDVNLVGDCVRILNANGYEVLTFRGMDR